MLYRRRNPTVDVSLRLRDQSIGCMLDLSRKRKSLRLKNAISTHYQSLVRRRSRFRRLRYLCLFIFNRLFFNVLLASMTAGIESSTSVSSSQRGLSEVPSHGVISSSRKRAATVSDAGAAGNVRAGPKSSCTERGRGGHAKEGFTVSRGIVAESDANRPIAVMAALLRHIPR